MVKKVPEPFLIPLYMGVTGDYLYVYKEREEFKFEFFSLPDCEYITSAGRQGQGPNDFNLLDFRSFRPSADGFSILEVGTNLLKTCSLKTPPL